MINSSMPGAVSIQPDWIVSDLLSAHPFLATVFIGHGMACPGCELAGFETLEDAARQYDLAPETLCTELQRALVEHG